MYGQTVGATTGMLGLGLCYLRDLALGLWVLSAN